MRRLLQHYDGGTVAGNGKHLPLVLVGFFLGSVDLNQSRRDTEARGCERSLKSVSGM